LWLYSLKVVQLLRSAACLHTNQSRSYLNHLVYIYLYTLKIICMSCKHYTCVHPHMNFISKFSSYSLNLQSDSVNNNDDDDGDDHSDKTNWIMCAVEEYSITDTTGSIQFHNGSCPRYSVLYCYVQLETLLCAHLPFIEHYN